MENIKNKPRRIAIDYSMLTKEQRSQILLDEKKARDKVRAKLASGEAIIIPKVINDFLEAKAS